MASPSSRLRRSYRTLSWLALPLLPLLLWQRRLRGKEDRVRIGERRGLASLVRPQGRLVWVHVASVGESLSVLPLVGRLLGDHPDLHLLMTSTTRTSADLLRHRLPSRAFHQFLPLDHPRWVARFLRHWQPDLALFVESEFWPNLLAQTRRRGCPAVLVNGRISARSAARWRRAPRFIASLLDDFALCLVPDGEQAARLAALGARRVETVGNLKLLDGRREGGQLRLNRQVLPETGRPVWIAASSHRGEEALILALHRQMRQRLPNLLTLLAPRHPDRCDEVIRQISETGLRFVTRSSGAAVAPDHELLLIDSLGELPDYYAACDLALICGSLLPGVGGHNPIEALHRDCTVVVGPHMANFASMMAELRAAGAIAELGAVEQPDDVAAAADLLHDLLSQPERRRSLQQAARRYLDQHARVLERTLAALAPLLDPLTADQGGR